MAQKMSYEDQYLARKVQANAQKRRRKRRHVIFRLVVFIIILAAVIWGVYFSLGVFLKVEKISIKGEKVYSDQEVLKASGIKQGENIFNCRPEVIAGKIKDKLLNVENVDVKRKLPNTILIVLHRAKPNLALEFKGQHVILSKTKKILQKNVLTIPRDLDIILNVDVKTPVCGKKLKDSQAERKVGYFSSLKQSAKRAGVGGAIACDLGDLQDVIIYCGPNRNIKVKFGGLEQLDYKMRFLSAIFNGSVDERMQGEIDMSGCLTSRRAVWRPVKNNVEVVEKKNQEQAQESE